MVCEVDWAPLITPVIEKCRATESAETGAKALSGRSCGLYPAGLKRPGCNALYWAQVCAWELNSHTCGGTKTATLSREAA
jgi:hypothetical protein